MEKSLPTQRKLKTAPTYKATALALLAAMNHLEEQMAKDHARSERLKVETQVIKAETQIIKARTETTLARLQEHVNYLTGVL